MIAAYNAGPARYAAYLARRQRLPAETVAYLNVVTGRATGTPITPLTQPPQLLFVLRRDLGSARSSQPNEQQRDELFAVRRSVP